MRTVYKAFAYITHRDRLLVFREPAFPEIGLQVPAGTVKPGEPLELAVLRESIEETGWREFSEPVLLGRAQFDCTPFGKDEVHDRAFFHLRIQGDPPETWRHYESDPHGGGPAIEFSFSWMAIRDAELELAVNHGALLPELRRRLRS